jgi:hypothetical protein
MNSPPTPDEPGTASTPEPVGAPPAAMRDTHFDFQHRVFNLPGAFFHMDQATKQPVLHMILGELKATLPFKTLKESFDISEGSHDARLLDIVTRGLAFVKQIRPGERIPGELLDGRASWSVEDRHRTITKGRLTVQLVSWVTGSEVIVVDLQELEQIVEDPQTKSRLKSAFTELGEKLGIRENAEQFLNDRLDDLAQELSYIEALRERFKAIQAINANLTKIAQIYRTDRSFCDEIARMQGLLRKPLKDYDSIFEQADAQTGEIFGALKSFKPTVQFIRKIRDELRARLLEWEELLQAWEGVPLERSSQIEQLQKMTYRFLASRFIETAVWERK